MELTVDRSELARALGIVGKASSARSFTPVLRNFALQAEENGLRISATDLEVYIRSLVPASVQDTGALCVGPLFGEFVNRAQGDEMTITSTRERVVVQCGRDVAKFPFIDIDEFPAWNSNVSEICRITSGVITDLVKRVIFSAATDESRPILSGINVEMSDGKLTMVTADGFRLAVASAKVSNDKQLATVIPARAMGMLSAFQNGDIVLYAPEKGDLNAVVFSNGDLEIASQAIMGKYPDYRQIIPADTGTRMTVNRADLIRACKVVNVFAKSAANVVIFDVNSDKLILTGEASEVGDGRSELDIELNGGGTLTIGFNCTYMLETLASMDCEKVVVGMKDNSAPATVRPADGEDHLCVIMPMHFTSPQVTLK